MGYSYALSLGAPCRRNRVGHPGIGALYPLLRSGSSGAGRRIGGGQPKWRCHAWRVPFAQSLLTGLARCSPFAIIGAAVQVPTVAALLSVARCRHGDPTAHWNERRSPSVDCSGGACAKTDRVLSCLCARPQPKPGANRQESPRKGVLRSP